MDLEGLRGSHVGLVARSAVRNGLRGGSGLVFLFVALITGLGVASVFISPVEEVLKQARKHGVEANTQEVLHELVDKIGKPAIRRFTDAGPEQVDYLLTKKPAVVSAILIVNLFLLPFLVSLGSFNVLSGDIGSRGVRYLLLRTERSNLFLGRLLGTFLFTVVVLALLVGIILVYLMAESGFYPAGDVALWMGQGFVAMALFAMPYVALCSWISAGTDSPFLSLVLGQLVLGFYPLLVYLGRQASEPVRWAGYIMPWPLKYELLHPSPLHWLGAAAAMTGFTALFTWLGLWTFQRRDV